LGVDFILAQNADHIVISEIYINEIKSGSEWIELYNPTDNDISIYAWLIDTKSYSNDITLPSAKIKAKGFYFIGDQSSGSWTPDNDDWPIVDYSEAMTLANSDSWISLKNESRVLIDKVGWGNAVDFEGGAINTNPGKGQSFARKLVGEIIQDTDNNQNDFVVQETPNPQNSFSEIEYIDETPPVITIGTYITTPTNQDITVTSSTNEGTLNFISHLFTENGSFEFIATDEIGNSTTKTVEITNIDKLVPSVEKLGDNSVDVVLSVGDIDLVFSEELSSNSKTAVQNALTAGANHVFAYLWSSSTLTITVTEETTFANDVIVNVSDVVGNTAELLLIDSALATNQTTSDGSGDSTVSNSTPEVVITNPGQEVNITISSGTTNPTIDISSFITDGAGTLPAITISSANANNATVEIPDSTTVTSDDSSWNGIIIAPTVTNVILPEVSGQEKTLGTAIEIGFSGAKLSFDKAVRILLPGQAEKRAGYVRDGIEFTEIDNICDADGQSTGDALSADGECKIDIGSDLIIWTKHFTKFATYVQSPVPQIGNGSFVRTLSPPTDVSFNLNSTNGTTTTQNVTLTLGAKGATQMAVSNNPEFTGVSWEDYSTNKIWTLTEGGGQKTVYALFRNAEGDVSQTISDSITMQRINPDLDSSKVGEVKGVTDINITDGDIIQCKLCSNPFAVYVVKKVGETKYIRHLVSLKAFNSYGHLKWENLRQLNSLVGYFMSRWVRVASGEDGSVRSTDKVHRIENQEKRWINMSAEKFLASGGSDKLIFSVNQKELALYATGADVVMLN